jgi:N-formylglutamate amidohydrolase
MSPSTSEQHAFEIVSPPGARVPWVAHVPHASTVIPDEVRGELLIPNTELAEELLMLTDWHTDRLFAGMRELGLTLFVNRLSRLVFDPERFLDDSAEPMAARGQGVVYWLGTRLQLLREASTELRAARVRELYQPYHRALDEVVTELLAAFGSCTVVDCHSFPSEPLPSEADQRPDRPDICLGTDRLHTPPDLVDALEAGFGAAGYRVYRDRPFAGTFVPSGHYGRDPRVRSVMIEVNRRLYMDEATAARLPAFDTLAGTIARVVGAALSQTAQGPG